MFDFAQFILGVLVTVAIYGIIFTALYINEKLEFVKLLKESVLVRSKITRLFVFIGVPIIIIVVGLIAYYGVPTKEYDYIARFKNAGRIDKGSEVYYRGRNIGRVTEVYFSPDSAYVLARFKIDEKDVKVYKDSYVGQSSRSLIPRNILKIIPPDDIKGKSLLKKGSVLDEEPVEKKDPVVQVLSSLYKDKKFGKIIDNLEEATDNFNKFSDTLASVNKDRAKDIDGIIKDSSQLINGLNQTTNNLNNIIGDKETMNDLKSTINASKNTLQSVDKFINNADDTVSRLGDAEFDGNLDASIKSLSEILTNLKDFTSDEEIKENLKSLLNDSNEAIVTLKCFSKESSKLLGKRFLIPRMTFGAPGKNLKYCFENEKLISPKAQK